MKEEIILGSEEDVQDDPIYLTMMVANDIGLVGQSISTPEGANELIAAISSVECGVECCVKTHEELKRLAILAVNIIKLGLIGNVEEEMSDFPSPFGQETPKKSPFEVYGDEQGAIVVDSPLSGGEND